eukprot:scaffold145178_cov145-Phaeocystis_antarctica.AAC.1
MMPAPTAGSLDVDCADSRRLTPSATEGACRSADASTRLFAWASSISSAWLLDSSSDTLDSSAAILDWYWPLASAITWARVFTASVPSSASVEGSTVEQPEPMVVTERRATDNKAPARP